MKNWGDLNLGVLEGRFMNNEMDGREFRKEKSLDCDPR